MKTDIDMVNGDRWQKFLTRCLPALIKFQFKFMVAKCYHEIDQILDSFSSAFWLKEKRWFVVVNEVAKNCSGGESIISHGFIHS